MSSRALRGIVRFTPRSFFCLDALQLFAHGGMIDWNVATTCRPLFRREYPFFVLRGWVWSFARRGSEGTYRYRVCLVPFWITVAEKNEYGEEDVDCKLEHL
jgi:hypothetical protein